MVHMYVFNLSMYYRYIFSRLIHVRPVTDGHHSLLAYLEKVVVTL